MAEIEKSLTVEDESPTETEEVTVELENNDPSKVTMEEVADVAEEFYSNMAEDMDERVLQRISKQLVDDYKRDRVSRKDWETSYSQALDLLGFRYMDSNLHIALKTILDRYRVKP